MFDYKKERQCLDAIYSHLEQAIEKSKFLRGDCVELKTNLTLTMGALFNERINLGRQASKATNGEDQTFEDKLGATACYWLRWSDDEKEG